MTVLGCSGSYGSPAGGACSGYLVRSGATVLWLDCGPARSRTCSSTSTSPTSTAVVITPQPSRPLARPARSCHVAEQYGLERDGLPVYARPRPRSCSKALRRRLWPTTFDWQLIADGDASRSADARAARSPAPTIRRRRSPSAIDARRQARSCYTADTGPAWSLRRARRRRIDLALCEATLPEHEDGRADRTCSARQAGGPGPSAGVRTLVLTHLWPSVDPRPRVAGPEAFGAPVDGRTIATSIREARPYETRRPCSPTSCDRSPSSATSPSWPRARCS